MGKLDAWGAFVDRSTGAGSSSAVGPLSGLRLAVKDNIAVAGLKWTAGLPLLEDRIAQADASCVAALRAGGVEVVGTVATDSAGFGMMTPGVVNPLAADRTVGGSSGGSAAAVAANLADLALGTDTAGSVRVPAACCGLFGLKPTHGTIPLDGVTPLSTTFDHVGVLARELDVLELAMRVLTDGYGRTVGSRRRIGFDATRLAGTDEVIRNAIERTLSWLAGKGHALIEIELPPRTELAEMHGTIVCGEARDYWRPHWPRDAKLFSDTARRSLTYACSVEDRDVAAAREQVGVARTVIAAAFEVADLIIGPTIAVEPPVNRARRVTLDGVEVPVVFALLAETCPFNISGDPALAMPLPWLVADGIPISLQIAARRGMDADVLALARELAGMGSVG